MGLKMQRGGPEQPDLFARLSPKQLGGVSELRDGLNQLHLQRDSAVEDVKRKMRAASYDFGAQDWRGLFAAYDTDRSGGLDFHEFMSVCRKMGVQPTHLSDDELWIVFEEVDATRRGIIEVTDFSRWLSGASPEYQAAPAGERMEGWTYGGSYGSANPLLNMPVPEEIIADNEKPPPLSAASVRAAGAAALARARAETSEESASPARAARKGRGWGKGKLDGLVGEVGVLLDGVVEEQLRDLVYFLSNEVGLSKQRVMGLAIAHPAFFQHNLDKEIRPRVDYLREFGVPASKVGNVLVGFPGIVRVSLDRVEDTMSFLESLGMPLHSIGKCVGQHPQLLGLGAQSNLQPTVEFLTNECRIPREKVGGLIASFPTVLAYSIETTLKPRLDYILNDLNVPKHKLAVLILKFPQLLGLAVETNMQPTVAYMVKELGVQEREISKIIQQHPQLLGLSVEGNLKPKVSFLLDDIGVPRERLPKIIASFPTLLSLSTESNLRPKLEYLTTEGGFSREDLMKAPNLLAYSLNQRIRPRVEFIRANGIEMALHSILCLSNAAFADRFDGFETPAASS